MKKGYNHIGIHANGALSFALVMCTFYLVMKPEFFETFSKLPRKQQATDFLPFLECFSNPKNARNLPQLQLDLLKKWARHISQAIDRRLLRLNGVKRPPLQDVMRTIPFVDLWVYCLIFFRLPYTLFRGALLKRHGYGLIWRINS
jgi:hypothetical protein